MSQDNINLGLIIGSVRGGRLGTTVAGWLADQVRQFGEFNLDVIDLADYDLPVAFPEFGAPPPPETAVQLAELSPRLAAADAFAVVTPEYNHSFPAVLKNVIDWHKTEWYAKPVGMVSYGGISGGLRAVEHLRQVFAELHAVAIRDTVSFHDAWSLWDTEGNWPRGTVDYSEPAKVLLNQLSWWARAMVNAKAVRPFPA
jgi:NAD(P)H-dependent FMN reductase